MNRNILCFVCGLVLLTGGLYMVYEPLALVVPGLICVLLPLISVRDHD